MNKNTGKAVLSVIVTIASVISMADQFISGKKQQKEFEDMKKAVAELQKKN